jgi:LPS export ABC transporter protein LptC
MRTLPQSTKFILIFFYIFIMQIHFSPFLYLLLALLPFFSACENELKDVQQIVDAQQAGIERADSVILFYSDSATVRMAAQAPSMLYYLDPRNPRREFPKGIHVDFFDEFRQPSSQLTAQYAEQSDQTQKITLRDSVVIWNRRNQQLKTEELICDEREQKIYTHRLVTITTPTYIIYGTGFHSNLDFSDWYLDTVRGTVQTNSDLDNPIY